MPSFLKTTMLLYKLFQRNKDSKLLSSPDLILKSLLTIFRSFWSLKNLVCTRLLKIKIKNYETFHVSIIEHEFSLINNTDVCLVGYLIAPFYDELTPSQVFSSIHFTGVVQFSPVVLVGSAEVPSSLPITVMNSSHVDILYRNVREHKTKCSGVHGQYLRSKLLNLLLY
jgi:hypothetical protein